MADENLLPLTADEKVALAAGAQTLD